MLRGAFSPQVRLLLSSAGLSQGDESAAPCFEGRRIRGDILVDNVGALVRDIGIVRSGTGRLFHFDADRILDHMVDGRRLCVIVGTVL